MHRCTQQHITFTYSIVCDPSSKQCMTQEWVICGNKISTYEPAIGNAESKLAYFQWQRMIVSQRLKLKVQPKMHLLIHVYFKRKQSPFMEKLINNVNNRSIVLQVDFSENVTLACQNELQSVHWQHSQAALSSKHMHGSMLKKERALLLFLMIWNTLCWLFIHLCPKYIPCLEGNTMALTKLIFYQMILVVNLCKGFSFQIFIFGKKGSIVKCTGILLPHHMGKVSLMS